MSGKKEVLGELVFWLTCSIINTKGPLHFDFQKRLCMDALAYSSCMLKHKKPFSVQWPKEYMHTSNLATNIL